MRSSLQQRSPNSLHALGVRADRLVIGVLVLGTIAALALGAINGPIFSGSAVALGLCTAGVLAWRLAPGSLLSRMVLATCGMLMVCLHIQLARGVTELHFGVFVFLAFLLVYRDWRPIVMAAATIAVHHILFDRLQAAGWPVYCMTTPSFGLVLVHAAFVIVQTAVEVVMAIKLKSDAVEAAELHTLCQPTADGQLNLDVHNTHVTTPTAKSVHAAFLELDHLVGEARQTANIVLQGASHIANGNQDLQQCSDATAHQLKDVAKGMDNIKSSSQSSAQEAQNAHRIATQASEHAASCGSLVEQVVTAMDSIQQSSRRIGDIVGLIDSIAFQTNILALNAAVEAARAGEHGRGFAVVASEVRNLAQRSASASQDVRDLIESSLEQVKQSSSLASTAGHSMQSVVEHTSRAAQLIEHVSLLAQSQAQELLQSSQAVQELDKKTQANTQLMEQSSHSTKKLLQQAEKLQSVVSGVKASSQNNHVSAIGPAMPRAAARKTLAGNSSSIPTPAWQAIA